MSFLFKSKAQDAGNEEILMKSLIDLFNEAKEKGDAKLLDFVKRSWNAAKVKPNYKAMSNNPAYRKLDKMAQDANGDEVIAKRNGYSLVYNPVNNGYWFYTRNGEGIGLPRVANKQAAMIEFNRLVDGAQDSCGKDAAEFKVGDKVKHTQYGTIGKVFEIDPAGNVGVQWNNGQAYYGKTAKPISLIVAADSAAMDEITERELETHALYFARHELRKYADELRKKRNTLADIWGKTGIAQGAVRSGEYKQVDVDEYINPYVNVIEEAIRILERV